MPRGKEVTQQHEILNILSVWHLSLKTTFWIVFRRCSNILYRHLNIYSNHSPYYDNQRLTWGYPNLLYTNILLPEQNVNMIKNT